MPNTLAHFGAQGPLTRLTGVRVDAKWVLLGCVLPDVPWIARRGVSALAGGMVDPVALRLYALVQASLAFSVVLAGALALLSARPRPVFVVLALGAVLHLLLDAAQTKWGNGAHLFAPATWQTASFDLFWPESGVTVALVVAGGAWLGWEWARLPRDADDVRIPVAFDRSRAAAAALLAVAYLATPPVFFGDVLASGSHSLDVLVDAEDRAGREVELDRVRYRPSEGGDGPGGTLTATGGELAATGRLPSGAATVSVRGVFVDARTVRVEEHHVHRSTERDLASYLGLGLLAVVWVRDLAWTGKEEEA